MRRILVTGGNKGIGRAIVEAILAEHDDTFVYLGSRDAGRGDDAVAAVVAAVPSAEGRVRRVALDVTDEGSVGAAAREVAADGPLYAVVNNAGTYEGDLAWVLNVNTHGPRRVCEAFLPHVQEGGRLVMVSSASGPMYVASCRADRQRAFVDPEVTWAGIEALAGEVLGGAADGLPANAYGLSKALLNAYTLLLARTRPGVSVNACTPGFIATDLTRPFAESSGKTPAEMGMKSPAHGARAPMFLLFGEPEGNGRYYGSDAVRSPLDAYRSPGDPPYQGD